MKSGEANSAYTSRTGWYSLTHPSSWTVEEEDDLATFCDPVNGVGALQISAFKAPTPQDPTQLLLEYLSDNRLGMDRKKLKDEMVNGKKVASYSYEKPPWFKRIWFVCEGNYVLFITYNCKIEYEGQEDREVEKIVSSVNC
jgi:hypothetical protein